MTQEVRTDVVVGAKERGFAQVIQSISKLVSSSQQAIAKQIKGFADLEKQTTKFGKSGQQAVNKAFSTKQAVKEIKDLEGQMKALASEQQALVKAMARVKEGTAEYKALSSQLDTVQDKFSKAAQQSRVLNTAFKGIAQTMKQGAFTQGFMQGAGIGSPHIQRGPGMGRQIAGQMVGGMARGAGSAIFGGVGGLSQAIGGIPFVGGILSGQLNTAMGFAQQALGFQQARGAMTPFLGSGASIGAAGRSARARVARPADMLNEAQINAQVKQAGAAARAGFQVTPEMQKEVDRRTRDMIEFRTGVQQKSYGTYDKAIIQRANRNRAEKWMEYSDLPQKYRALATKDVYGESRRGVGQQAEKAERERLEAPGRKFVQEQRLAQHRAEQAEERRLFGGVYRAGANLAGISKQAALQHAAQITQAGGGGIADLSKQGLVSAGFSAQRAFGVGADVTGAFLQAGRRGGMLGVGSSVRGGATGGDAFKSALGDAVKLGLEGSEIAGYMQQMASGIQQWKATGIPVNAKSISDLSTGMAKAGLDAQRATAVSGGVTRSAQQIARNGPQNALEMMVLEELGGYKGGGVKELEKANLNMEQGRHTSDDVKRLQSRIYKAAGGGAMGRMAVVDAMRGLGIEVSRTEAAEGRLAGVEGEAGAMAGVNLAAERSRRRQGARTGAKLGRKGGLDAYAAETVSDAERRQAINENRQLDIGKSMIEAMQNLDKSSSNVTEAFKDLTAGPLKTITAGMEEMTKLFPDFVKAVKRIAQFGGGGGGWMGD